MSLILVISLALISYMGQISGNLREDSLAYKVINAENKIDEVISKAYKDVHYAIEGVR